MRNTHKLTRRVLTISALALSFVIAGWQAPTLMAYSNKMAKAVRSAVTKSPAQPAEAKAAAAPVAAMQELTKEQKHARMKELQNQIAASKGQAGQQAALDAALVELKQISDSMGGDLPANEGPSTPGQTGGAPPTIGVIPPAGQGCVLTTAVTTNSTPVAIPTGPAVVTSTVTVAGAGPYIWDVNLRTAITHSFAADLDITIQSPAGTVVTLTTDNGAGNDNTFNGTVWDDDANPAGQVPYTTNNGLVTDHAYVNLTLASPLVPEEAMAAFNGEDPNGTWTITISDDLAGDGGSLDNWDLEISTLPAAPPVTTTSATQNTPVAIPTGPAVVTSTVVVAGAGATLSKLTLLTNITHSFAADLDITLQSPAGTVVTLTTDNGAGNDNTFNGTLWDDDANAGGQVPYTTNNGLATDHAYLNLTTATPLVPEEAMGAFIGEDPNGTWTITISDDLAGDGGSLDSWTLNVTTAGSCCTITCPTNQNAFAGANCTAVVNYPAPTTSGNCGSVTCAPASGATFPLGTTTVTCSVANGPSCSFTVSVADNTPPTVTCPAPISVVGDVPTVVNYTVPTAADNCGASVACVPNTGSSFPVGTTTVTCTATDGSQNMATCNFTVTVVPCTITCPTDQVAWTSGTSAPVNYPAPTTTGNCGTVTCSPASGSTFNVGTTTVTCSTTAGPSCSFNVTVNQLTLGAALADPIACTGPGNKVNGSFSATNNSGASATVSVSATLSNIAYLPNTATATQSGSIIVLANVISWTGTLGAG
ncbi:MAG: proprotein convertase P-domain-containing protein, partial [Acidobacteriota bacterium]|nr:proprotein convertase P-domain-containing protein [Acidobacteriota bacterium]